MAPIHYKATVLPDGHLPLPPELAAHTGDEVDVTVSLPFTLPTEEEGRKQIQYLMKHWAGAAKGTGESLAQDHDEYLYGGR
ncbi:MAG: hypothetical protein HY716_09200 [Planctomycetes bacterium]|nr:hypothetical protein [Planctomycetota bacterium]